MYFPDFALVDFSLPFLEPEWGSLYKAGKAAQKSWHLRRASTTIREDQDRVRFYEIMCQVL